MTKFEKLGEVLTDAANLATPTSGGANPDHDNDLAVVYGELCYRVGRAISLYRAIKHEKN